MQEKPKFHVEQTTSGELIYREEQTMLGEKPKTLIFKTRKELADYINPQVSTPAALSIKETHAKYMALIDEIEDAYGDYQKMHKAMTDLHKFSAEMSKAKLQKKENSQWGEPLYIRVPTTNTLPDVEYKFIIAGDQIDALMNEATKYGYQGRLRDYIDALEVAMSFIGKHGVTIKAPVKTFPDNPQNSDADLPELVRARRSGDTVKVSINDLQDDGK